MIRRLKEKYLLKRYGKPGRACVNCVIKNREFKFMVLTGDASEIMYFLAYIIARIGANANKPYTAVLDDLKQCLDAGGKTHGQ